ncbi:hypothetical protein [Pseudoxanthobacter soli]|nr:hypothetical protein [Pseudoxanthobacter soli]
MERTSGARAPFGFGGMIVMRIKGERRVTARGGKHRIPSSFGDE